ncbi:MAG: hypothetical protein AAGA89_04905 [Pseudomonadota bacterium]
MPDTSAVVKTKSSALKKSARKRLYELHSWLGFHLATWWYGPIQGPAVSAQQVFTNELQDGAIQARLGIAQTADGEYTGLIRLEVGASGDRPNLKHAARSVHVGSNDEPVLLEQRARPFGRVTEFRFNAPIDVLSTASMIATELTFQSGQTKVFQWTSFKPTI